MSNKSDLILVFVLDNITDIIQSLTQFILYLSEPLKLYSIYQKYLNTGILDGILPETVNVILDYIGVQENLYSGSVFAFSAYDTQSLKYIEDDNNYWAAEINKLLHVLNSYTNISRKQTFNIFNTLECKPAGLLYYKCIWEIMHGLIEYLLSNLLSLLSIDYDAYRFPVLVLRVNPIESPMNIQPGQPYILFNKTIIHNKGIVISYYFRLNSSVPYTDSVTLTVTNNVYHRLIYRLQYFATDINALRYINIELDSSQLATTDLFELNYDITIKIMFDSYDSSMDICAVEITLKEDEL